MALINTNGERLNPPYIIDGIRHPDDIEMLWSGAQLAAIGLAVEMVTEPEPVKIDLVAYAAEKRWEKEVGGMTFDGISLKTDDRTKLMLLNARLRAMGDPSVIEKWIAANGEVYDLDAALLQEIGDAMTAHVSKCFAVFAVVKAGIDEGTFTSMEEVDAAFAAI